MRKLIILSSLIISGVFLYFAFSNFIAKSGSANPDQVNDFQYLTEDYKIDLGYFDENYSTDKITAVGVIGSVTCATCVTEFFEFSDQISAVNDEFFNSNTIEKYYAIIGNAITDSVSVQRFKRAHNISEKIFYVSLNSELGQQLYEWEKNKYLSQWVFVSNKSSTISSRILVLNRLTPIPYKKTLVDMAIFGNN